MDKKLKTNELIETYSEYLIYQKGLSENTVNSYVSDLKKLSYYLQDTEITQQSIENYFKDVSEFNYSTSTKKRYYSTIKNFLNYLYEVENLVNIKVTEFQLKSNRKLPEVLSVNEIEKMINFYKHDNYLNSRNLTVIDVLYSTGCRVSELCNISLSDIDLVDSYIKLKGKGSKERIVPIGTELKQNLLIYLKIRETFIKSKGEALFLSKSKNELDRTAVFRIIKNTALKVSLDSTIHPHTLRHSTATHMLEGGCDLRTVQEFLGHSSVSTTQIYTKVTKEFLEEAFLESHPRS